MANGANIDIEEFYRVAFKSGEGMAFQERTMKTNGEGYWAKNHIRLQAPGSVSSIPFTYSCYSINPIDPYHDLNPDNESNWNKPRASKENVMSYRNMLFECDNLTLKTQTARINKSKLPYSAKIFSGNRSYHYQIFFDNDLTEEQYEATYIAIAEALRPFGYQADMQCKNPNRMARAPFQTREGTETVQTLEEWNGLVSYQSMLDWLKSRHVDIKPIQKVLNQVEYTGPGDADSEYRFNDAVTRTVRYNGEYGITPRQPWLYKLACQCKSNGLTESDALGLIGAKYEHEEPYKVASAIKNAYKYSKVQLRTVNLPSLEEIEEIQYSRPAFENYIRINDDFWYIRGDGQLQSIKPTTICSDWGEKAHLMIPRERKYEAFTMVPNILEQRRTIIDNGVRKFNLYNSPEWKILPDVKEEDIPYTMHMLKRFFHGNSENQLEVGLDWLYIFFFKPEQKLPVLVNGGPHDVGKDFFMEWLCAAVGGEGRGEIIEGNTLGNNFNFDVGQLWLKCYNEVKLSHDGGIEQSIKNYVTASRIRVEAKGKDAYYINNISRFIFSTNYPYDFMKVEDKENRYWLRFIDYITDEDRRNYPNYKENVMAEMQKAISYLYTRGLVAYPKNEMGYRFWFPYDAYKTSALDVLKYNSKSDLELAIEDVLQAKLRMNPEIDHFCVRAESLKQFLKSREQFRDMNINNGTIQKILIRTYHVEPKKALRVDMIDGREVNSMFFEIPRGLVIDDEINIIDVDKRVKTPALDIDSILEGPKGVKKNDNPFRIFDPAWNGVD